MRMEKKEREPKIEMTIQALYVGKRVSGDDVIAKAFLFDTESVYKQHIQRLFGNINSNRMYIARVVSVVYAEDDDACEHPYFNIELSVKDGKMLNDVINTMKQPVIVADCQVVSDTDGTRYARFPRFELYELQEYIDNARQKIMERQRRVFPEGSIMPKNQSDTNTKEDAVQQTVEYQPVEVETVSTEEDAFKQQVVNALKNMNVKPSFSL